MLQEKIAGVKIQKLQILPLREVLQNLLNDAEEAQSMLSTNASTKEICRVLERIYNYPVDDRISMTTQCTIHDDIFECAQAMLMHSNDVTRLDMCDSLSVLIGELERAIAKESAE